MDGSKAKGGGMPSHHLGNAMRAAGRLCRSYALYRGEIALSRHSLEIQAT